jgi:hypothetical protein
LRRRNPRRQEPVRIQFLITKDTSMKKYVTKQKVAALARIAVFGALTLLVAGFSPAIAATLSRSVDVGVTLSTVWSMIGPLFAIRDWLPPFDNGSREPRDQIISLS